MSNDFDQEYIYDGVIGFLTSPIWSIPMEDFIDQHSVVFGNREENELAWTEEHEAFRKLTDQLLTSYMADVGITDDQFIQACDGLRTKNIPEVSRLFEQVFAAEDFNIFKAMMVRRNEELQHQALLLIESRSSKLPFKGPSDQATSVDDDDKILKDALRISELEFNDVNQRLRESELEFERQLEQAMKASAEEHNRSQAAETGKKEEPSNIYPVLSTIKSTETSSGTSASSPAQSASPTKTVSPAKSSDKAPMKSPAKFAPEPTKIEPSANVPAKDVDTVSSSTHSVYHRTTIPQVEVASNSEKRTEPDAASKWIIDALQENKTGAAAGQTASAGEDMAVREAYLRQMRDAIVMKKNAARKQQLDVDVAKQPSRPMSGRVARNAVSTSADSSNADTPTEEQLRLRKSLAQKLKKEVIGK